MSYFDIVNEAIDLVVVTNERTGATYLEPCYKTILRDADIHLPGDPLDEELHEIVKLEVKKRNANTDFVRPVCDWVYSVITNAVDPLLQDEKNELMKNMMEYLKFESEHRENVKDNQENVPPQIGDVPELSINTPRLEVDSNVP